MRRVVAIVPFEVSEERTGFGVGLAAFLHAALHADAHDFVLARLFARSTEGDSAPGELEAHVTPSMWRKMSQTDTVGGPPVALVLTGELVAPDEGDGHLELTLFAPHDGGVVAHELRFFDADEAGEALATTLQNLCATAKLTMQPLDALQPLGWDALESLIEAEGSMVGARGSDPDRGRDAALMHLARALGEAPDCEPVAERIAQLVDLLCERPPAGGYAFAERLLEGARRDAPEWPQLLEAQAALCFARRDYLGANDILEGLAAQHPPSLRANTLRARCALQARRPERALELLEATHEHVPGHPLLANLRALTLFDLERHDEARALLFELLDRGMLSGPAWVRLIEEAHRDGQEAFAGRIVDRILIDAAPGLGAVQRALELVLEVEPRGLARAERVRALAERILDSDPTRTDIRLVLVEERYALKEPEIARDVEAALRAVRAADSAALAQVTERAARLARLVDVWAAHLAHAIGARRMQRWDEAARAVERGLELLPWCPLLLEEKALIERETQTLDKPQGTLGKLWERWRPRA